MNPLFVQVILQNFRIGGSDAFAGKPGGTGIVHILGNGQGDTALAETQFLDDIHRQSFFNHFVITDNTQVGRAVIDQLGDVIVAHIEHFDGEIGRRSEEFPFRVVDIDSDFS